MNFGEKARKCQICSTSLKRFFWEYERNLETFKNFLLIIELTITFKSLPNTPTKSTKCFNIGARLQNAKFNLPYKISFCEARKILKLSRTFFLIFEIPKLKTCFESSQNLNWNSWVIEFNKMAPKCQILSTNANHFCGKMRHTVKLCKNSSLILELLEKKLDLWSVRDFWVIERSYKIRKCKICSTNAKLFFWEGDAKRETF